MDYFNYDFEMFMYGKKREVKDLLGNVIERSKSQHPYSYSPFCYYLNGKREEVTATIYSDRLWQWDYDKVKTLIEKHFEGKGQMYAVHNIKKLEAFFAEYLEKDKVKVIALIEGCNVSNGYPYWCVLLKY